MTLNEFYKKHNRHIENAITSALKEDDVYNDVTTGLLGKAGNRTISAVLLCKEDCILAGLDIFKKVYDLIDPNIKFRSYYEDGDFVRNKNRVLAVKSSLRNLLIGERTALNFLQKMSGIASLTNRFVSRLKFKESTILHTRKTTPNFRLFEIAAVKTGGGDFHRLSLSSAVMLKDNHIAAAGSVQEALGAVKNKNTQRKNIEIEVKTLKEASEVVEFGKGLVSIVMLDNFKERDLDRAILMLKSNGFKIEVSGGINEKNFEQKQRKGIDFYSIGMLTHSYKSIDFSLEF